MLKPRRYVVAARLDDLVRIMTEPRNDNEP